MELKEMYDSEIVRIALKETDNKTVITALYELLRRMEFYKENSDISERDYFYHLKQIEESNNKTDDTETESPAFI